MNKQFKTFLFLIIALIQLGMSQQSLGGTLDFCPGIKFKGVEFLKSQGAFGSETPKRYSDFTVKHGFIREIKISKYPELIGIGRNPFYAKKHPAWGQFIPTDHYWVPDRPMQSQELCTLAQKKGIKNIAIVCTGDTQSKGVFKSTSHLKSECFLSTHIGPGSIEEYEQKIWGSKSTYQSLTYNRYDTLKQIAPRKDIYSVAMRKVINNLVDAEIEKNNLTQKDLQKLANENYFFRTYGQQDMTISPTIENCINILPHEIFKKWVKIQMELEKQIREKNSSHNSYTSKENQELVEKIMFILLSTAFFF